MTHIHRVETYLCTKDAGRLTGLPDRILRGYVKRGRLTEYRTTGVTDVLRGPSCWHYRSNHLKQLNRINELALQAFMEDCFQCSRYFW